MSHVNMVSRDLLAATILALLPACSTTVPVKEVTSDKMGYLSKNFSAHSLSPAIEKKMPSDGARGKFERLTIKTEDKIEDPDGKKNVLDNSNHFLEQRKWPGPKSAGFYKQRHSIRP
ncbi:MAG TPA: hypothetical protein VFK88_09610 [Gallionella sp.]|nr:hypothetical protein [Gallionella sp.]